LIFRAFQEAGGHVYGFAVDFHCIGKQIKIHAAVYYANGQKVVLFPNVDNVLNIYQHQFVKSRF